MSESCNGKINKTRYDDLGKPIKQTSFTVKNLGGKLPKKQSTIIKRSFRPSTKHLSLDSTISVDKLTAKTFYCFRTSELFNIWMPPFDAWIPSTWLTNCTNPSMRLNHQLEEDVGCKVLPFINNEDQEALGCKTLRRKDTIASFRENKASVTFCIYSPCILLCDCL